MEEVEVVKLPLPSAIISPFPAYYSIQWSYNTHVSTLPTNHPTRSWSLDGIAMAGSHGADELLGSSDKPNGYGS
jgi:hypothetical protein